MSEKRKQPPKLPSLRSPANNKKLKCLHLKEGSIENQDSLFTSDIEIKLPDIILLEELFKIQDKSSSSSGKSTKCVDFIDKKTNPISNLVDTNKITGIVVAMRSLQKYIKIESILELISSIMKESAPIDEQILDIVFSPDVLQKLQSMLINETEIATILENCDSDKYQAESDLDQWLIKLSHHSEIGLIINSLMELQKIKNEIVEISFLYENLIQSYHDLLKNQNLVLFILIILRINNQLNKETGKKELTNFDLISLDNLLDLKINSKLFIDICLDVYIENSNKQGYNINIFSKKEISSLQLVLENDISLDSDSLNYFSEKIILIRKELLSVVKNENFQKRVEVIFDLHLNNLNQIRKSLDMEFEFNEKLFKYFSIKFVSELNLQRKTIKNLIKNFLILGKKSELYICKYLNSLTLSSEKTFIPQEKNLDKSQMSHVSHVSAQTRNVIFFQKETPKDNFIPIEKVEAPSSNKENIKPKSKQPQTHGLLNNKYNLNY